MGKENLAALAIALASKKKLFLVHRFGKALAAFGAAGFEHVLPRGGGAAFAKAVFAFRLGIAGLERSFHGDFLVGIFRFSVFSIRAVKTFLPWLVNGKKNSFQDRWVIFFEKKALAKTRGGI